MPEATIDFLASSYSKTPAGQAEIQSRSLGLAPLARRLLVLVDGKRTGAELAPFVAGQDLGMLVQELLKQELVSVSARAAFVAPAATLPSAVTEVSEGSPVISGGTDWLAALPSPEARSAKDLEMARNFMTNTVNNIFGHHNRISLIEAIFSCQTSSELRGVYGMWAAAMESSNAGAKRLPEFREKLFAVL